MLPAPLLSHPELRLIEAAGEIFASRGFEAATVKEITEAAQMNGASVNYHFGDKFGLYCHVLRCAVPSSDRSSGDSTALPPTDRLRHFVITFTETILGAGRPTWANRLMAREMAQPTQALTHVVEEVMRPNYSRLRSILGLILARPPDSEAVRLCAHSVIAQCVHWALAQSILPHLWPSLSLKDPAQVRRIAEHLADFSLAGVVAAAARPRSARIPKKKHALLKPHAARRRKALA